MALMHSVFLGACSKLFCADRKLLLFRQVAAAVAGGCTHLFEGLVSEQVLLAGWSAETHKHSENTCRLAFQAENTAKSNNSTHSSPQSASTAGSEVITTTIREQDYLKLTPVASSRSSTWHWHL